MGARRQGGPFKVTSSLIPSSPVSKLCGVFSYRVLPSSYGRNKAQWQSLSCFGGLQNPPPDQQLGEIFVLMPHTGVLRVYGS